MREESRKKFIVVPTLAPTASIKMKSYTPCYNKPLWSRKMRKQAEAAKNKREKPIFDTIAAVRDQVDKKKGDLRDQLDKKH